jgi:hypothetical protein
LFKTFINAINFILYISEYESLVTSLSGKDFFSHSVGCLFTLIIISLAGAGQSFLSWCSPICNSCSSFLSYWSTIQKVIAYILKCFPLLVLKFQVLIKVFDSFWVESPSLWGLSEYFSFQNYCQWIIFLIPFWMGSLLVFIIVTDFCMLILYPELFSWICLLELKSLEESLRSSGFRILSSEVGKFHFFLSYLHTF